MKIKLLLLVLLVLAVMLTVVGSCARRLVNGEPARIWTPAPVSGAPLVGTRPAEILPTLALPAATRQALPTRPPAAQPTAAPAPVLDPTSEPSPDPKQVTITESDVLRAIASGAAGQQGVSLDGVGVDFTDGKMVLSATRLTYGAINVNNLLLVGRLVAVQGQLRLETESITPRGLVTALIPTFANQALAQYTGQWYIEEVRTLDGRLELRIR